MKLRNGKKYKCDYIQFLKEILELKAKNPFLETVKNDLEEFSRKAKEISKECCKNSEERRAISKAVDVFCQDALSAISCYVQVHTDAAMTLVKHEKPWELLQKLNGSNWFIEDIMNRDRQWFDGYHDDLSWMFCKLIEELQSVNYEVQKRLEREYAHVTCKPCYADNALLKEYGYPGCPGCLGEPWLCRSAFERHSALCQPIQINLPCMLIHQFYDENRRDFKQYMELLCKIGNIKICCRYCDPPKSSLLCF